LVDSAASEEARDGALATGAVTGVLEAGAPFPPPPAAAGWPLLPRPDSNAVTTKSKSRLLYRRFKHAMIPRSNGWYKDVQFGGSGTKRT